MVFICYSCLHKIDHNIIKAHDKNFCCITCRNKYFTDNNYDCFNFDKFMEHKYFNITMKSFKKNNNYQYYKIINNIDINNINNFIKYIHNNDIKKLYTLKYFISIKNNFEKNINNYNKDNNNDIDIDIDTDNDNIVKKNIYRTCDIFKRFIYNCGIYEIV